MSTPDAFIYTQLITILSTALVYVDWFFIRTTILLQLKGTVELTRLIYNLMLVWHMHMFHINTSSIS